MTLDGYASVPQAGATATARQGHGSGPAGQGAASGGAPCPSPCGARYRIRRRWTPTTVARAPLVIGEATPLVNESTDGSMPFAAHKPAVR